MSTASVLWLLLFTAGTFFVLGAATVYALTRPEKLEPAVGGYREPWLKDSEQAERDIQALGDYH